jgi:hypothetical protein
VRTHVLKKDVLQESIREDRRETLHSLKKMTVASAIRLGFWFFVCFHVASQVVYLIGDVADRYEDSKLVAENNNNFCTEVCAVAGAAKRYGEHAHRCEAACKPSSRWPILGATREALKHYHLCGIDVPCVDALMNFAWTFSGAMFLLSALFMIPFVIKACFWATTVGVTSRLTSRRSRAEVDYRRTANGTTTITELDDQDHEGFFRQQRSYMDAVVKPRAQLEMGTWDRFRTWISQFRTERSEYLALGASRPHEQ